MATRKLKRMNPPNFIGYGYYNLGRYIGSEFRKKDAIKAAEKWTGKRWEEIKDYIEIHKIIIKKLI